MVDYNEQSSLIIEGNIIVDNDGKGTFLHDMPSPLERIAKLEAQIAAADDLLDAVEAWKNTCIETEDVGAAIARVELKRAAYRAAKGGMMTDAPERICAYSQPDAADHWDGATIVAYETRQDFSQEYIRADLSSPLGAVEAERERCAALIDCGGCVDHPCCNPTDCNAMIAAAIRTGAKP